MYVSLLCVSKQLKANGGGECFQINKLLGSPIRITRAYIKVGQPNKKNPLLGGPAWAQMHSRINIMSCFAYTHDHSYPLRNHAFSSFLCLRTQMLFIVDSLNELHIISIQNSIYLGEFRCKKLQTVYAHEIGIMLVLDFLLCVERLILCICKIDKIQIHVKIFYLKPFYILAYIRLQFTLN